MMHKLKAGVTLNLKRFFNAVAIILLKHDFFLRTFISSIYSKMESDHCRFTSIESEIKFTIYNTSPPKVS